MRFNKFIIEKNINDYFSNNDIITLYRSTHNYIYKNHNDIINEYNIYHNKEKIIIDKNYHLYEQLNKSFKKEFGWDVIKKGVITSGNEGDYIFVPLGNFSYIWSDKVKSLKESILNEEVVETYKMMNINSAIQSGNDIIFNCNKYILIDKNYIGEIL